MIDDGDGDWKAPVMQTPSTMWPIAVFEDRYTGVYSGGLWLAVARVDAMHHGMARGAFCLGDGGPHGEDGEAMNFWSAPPNWIAVGNTPNEAVRALVRKMRGADE